MTAVPDGLVLSESEFAIVVAILREHFPHRTVWAFGSRVRGTSRQFSDLDLAILADAPVRLADMANAAEAFADSDLPFKVDLVDWATTTERFREIIRTAHVVLATP